MRVCNLLILLGMIFVLGGCEDTTTPSHEAQLSPEFVRLHDDPATLDFYRTRVQPIFRQDCYRCHAGYKREGGLNMQTRGAMAKGGKHGRALIPGDVDNSLLIKGIRREDSGHVKPMPPPPQEKMPDADIAAIKRWVKAGAIMPETVNGK
jgi:mono/diheme cytochrome c family protein